MDIESILQQLGYNKIFNKDGSLSIYGNNAYGKLYEIFCELMIVGVMSLEDVEKYFSKIDKLIDEKH